jgi:large subunit ribosomal protein L23
MTIRVDDRDLPDLIRNVIVTEKATTMMEQNKYVFDVVPQANKTQIKAAIESLFNVKVKRVDTQNLPRKTRRVGKFSGSKPKYKRAVVTIVEGQEIILFPEV